MIEIIKHEDAIIAIIVRAEYRKAGIEFIAPKDFILQLGHMTRPEGYKVIPHLHNPVRRETIGTQEVLFIKNGRIRVDFYSFERVYLESRDLAAGDLILLAGGGHGISVLEAATIVEVKNGPFVEGADKGRFDGKKE